MKKPLIYLTRREIASILRSEARMYTRSYRWGDGQIHDVDVRMTIAALKYAAKIVGGGKKG